MMVTPKRKASKEKTILLFAPSGNDAVVACDILSKSGITSIPCSSVSDLCEKIHDETGAIVIAEEALSLEEILLLRKCLESQPPWSDLPVIVLTFGGELRKFSPWS